MNTSTRNSGIELLRLLAVTGIVAHHYVLYNAFDVNGKPWSINKAFLELVFSPLGKLGVVIFFIISAWFLCPKDLGFKNCIKRVWLLEREVLFWSLMLGASFSLLDSSFSMKSLMFSFIPIVSGQWWYVTSYVVFLLIAPFLTKGLRSLSQRDHQRLCILMLVMWSLISGLLPKVKLDMDGTVILFMFLYVLVSYWRWYGQPFTRLLSWQLFMAGYVITLVLTLLAVIAQMTFIPSLDVQAVTIGKAWSIQVLLMGFGLFSIFLNLHFSSRTINFLSRSAFAVYLLTEYPAMRALLWSQLFNLSRVFYSPYLPLIALETIFGIAALCILADLIRRGLFYLIIGRHPGCTFEFIWRKWVEKLEKLKGIV